MAHPRLSALVLPCLVMFSPVGAVVPKKERPRLMISEFPVANGAYEGWNGWGYGGGEGHISSVLQDLLISAMLDKAGDKVRLMERKKLDEVLAEQKLGASGLVDESTAVETGRLIGCRYMITGKVTRFAYKKSGFSTGWGVTSILNKVAPSMGAANSVAGDVHVGKASFTGRLDCRLIDIRTGEILLVAHEEGKIEDTSVKVAGTGSDVQYDQELVNKIFEPIVETIAGKLAKKLTIYIADEEENGPPPEVKVAVKPKATPPPPPPPPAAAPVQVPSGNVGVVPFMVPAGNGVEPVDQGLLKAMLPAAVGARARKGAEAQKTGLGGFRISKAEARYVGGDGHTLRLSITDCGGATGMMAAWSMVEQDKETDTGYEKMGRVNGRPVHEKLENDSQNGEYAVFVAGRFLVEAHGSQTGIEPLKQAVGLVDFAKLEALRDFGLPK